MKMYLCAILLFSTTLSAEIFYLDDGLKIDTSKKTTRIAKGSECGPNYNPDWECELTCYEGTNEGTSTYTCNVAMTALYFEKWTVGTLINTPLSVQEVQTRATPTFYPTGNSLQTFDERSVIFYPWQRIRLCFNLGKPLTTQDTTWVLAENYPQVEVDPDNPPCMKKDGDVPPPIDICDGSEWPLPTQCCDGTLPEIAPLCAIVCDGSEKPLPDQCCDGTISDTPQICETKCDGSVKPLPSICCDGTFPDEDPLCSLKCDGTEDPEPAACCDGTFVPFPDMCTVGPIGNDPLYPDAWHLNNTGQKNYAILGGTAGYDVKAKPVIEKGIRGRGVFIGVSDTGIEITHEDLADNYNPEGSKNFYLTAPYDGDPVPGGTSATDAHGTAVTGITAAVGGNDIGARGVAPEAKFGGFNYLAPGTLAPWSYQADGPFDIFNYSYGVNHCALTRSQDFYKIGYENGVNNLRGGKGALYVKAAGDDFSGFSGNCGATSPWFNTYYGNSNFDESQNYPYLMLAGAINANGKKASYSTPGSNIWITAPGGEDGSINPAIQAPDLSGCDAGRAITDASGSFENGSNPKNSDCNYTARMNGTGSATPNTSGVIALMLSANPSLTWRDVKHILATHSTLIDFPSGPYAHPGGRDLAGHVYQDGWVENSAGYYFHNYYGFGLVNAATAVDAAIGYKTDLGDFKESTFDSGSIGLEIPNNLAEGTLSSLTSNVDYTLEVVQVTVSLTHPYIDNIGIELYSPAGTKSIVLNINSSNLGVNLTSFTFLTNAFYGESSQGKWTLKVIDGSDVNPDETTGSSGTLTNWKLHVRGHGPASTLTSKQIPPKNILLSKNRKIKKFPAPKFTPRKKADPSERYAHPADPFLIKKNKEFLYAANIFAMAAKDYTGPSDRVIGELMGLKVITSPTKPKKGFYVVKSRATNRVGIYNGYIFAHGNDAEIEKALGRRNLKWDKVAGVYLIPSRFFAIAYNIRNAIRHESPSSTVELIIHFLLDNPL